MIWPVDGEGEGPVRQLAAAFEATAATLGEWGQRVASATAELFGMFVSDPAVRAVINADRPVPSRDERDSRSSTRRQRLPKADRVSAETRMGMTLLRLQAAATASRPDAPSWVHRRIESLEFLDTRAIRRRISVDFDVPADAPRIYVGDQEFRLVPITNLPKGNLVAFDLRDENDQALWLPTSEYSSHILASAIFYWAHQILIPRQGFASLQLTTGLFKLATDLTKIVSAETAEHDKAWSPFAAAAALIDAESGYNDARNNLTEVSDRLRAVWSRPLGERLTVRHFRELRAQQKKWARAQDRLTSATEVRRASWQTWNAVDSPLRRYAARLMADELFRSQLEDLARTFVVPAAVTSPPGTRRIVKLAFESPVIFRPPRGRLLRLMQSSGWRCWRLEVTIGGRGGSHHLEAAAPPGVDIVRITARPTPRNSQDKPISEPGGSPHVHIRLPASTPSRYRARILVRVSRPGWLTMSWLVALVISVVLFAGRLRLSVVFPKKPEIIPGLEAGTAATLLLALLAVVAAVLARPGEHPLASRLLFLARVLILIDAAVVLAASGALVLHRTGTHVTGTLWNWLLAISLLVTALLTVSRLLPVMRVPRGIKRLAGMLSTRWR
jgi:hypothetical protein